MSKRVWMLVFFFQAEDGIRDLTVTGVQTCALPIYGGGTADSADDDPRASVGLRRRKRRGGSCRTAPQWLWRRRVARGGVAAPRCALTATRPETAARSPPTLLSTGSLAIRSGELRFDTSGRAHPGSRG